MAWGKAVPSSGTNAITSRQGSNSPRYSRIGQIVSSTAHHAGFLVKRVVREELRGDLAARGGKARCVVMVIFGKNGARH